MRSEECGVRSEECGMWSVECGMWTEECGMCTEECGMWTEGHLNPCGPSYWSDRAKYDEIPWSMVQ